MKVLHDGTLRLAVRFSREVEAAELIVAAVQIDEDAGYVAIGQGHLMSAPRFHDPRPFASSTESGFISDPTNSSSKTLVTIMSLVTNRYPNSHRLRRVGDVDHRHESPVVRPNELTPGAGKND